MKIIPNSNKLVNSLSKPLAKLKGGGQKVAQKAAAKATELKAQANAMMAQAKQGMRESMDNVGRVLLGNEPQLAKAGAKAGAAKNSDLVVQVSKGEFAGSGGAIKGTGSTPKGFEKQAKSANDISKKVNEGKIKYASNYHGRLGKEKELEILSNPDSVYVAGNNSQNLIYMKGGNVVIVESKGSSKGNTITSYGPDGARGESGAAIFGGKPTDPGKPVTHDAIVNGTIPTPSGGTMPPATQILP
ncbi:hypothetical protein MHH70_04020 [Metasolibacillus sp. FSL H7-0170]|uniref:hypothetical protein n=1 Tax=Metasolibacillus sp. FSL H7-0170 TaxID=2921431 RepID=UPI00315864CB